jgi:hypothetical protein
MSEIKVNKISPRTNCGTVQLGDSGDTITIPAGATITNNGTQTGFGRTGTVDWQTSIKTSGFTAANGEGYFCNTTAGAFTVTLPASPSAGAIVAVKDYANTFDTNNLTIGRNGSNINGLAVDSVLSAEGTSITFVYADATKGWLVIQEGAQSDAPQPIFTAATGGTITTCGDFKIHTFTGPGTFTVTSVGNSPTVPSGGPGNVDYLVVAGGGGGGQYAYGAGGGGGGGFRESHTAGVGGPYTASPLATPSSLPVSVQGYPITVGAGGAGKASGSSQTGTNGANSIFSTITSAGGGGGGGGSAAGSSGGSGGGAGGGPGGGPGTTPEGAGSGNTPPVSPPQGQNGGTGIGRPAEPSRRGGGGGGAGGAGQAASFPPNGSNGGAGVTTGAKTSPATTPVGPGGFSGGSAGSGGSSPYHGTPGGFGAGVAGIDDVPDGQTNTGGGGGATGANGSQGDSGSGGSGIVVIRYKFQ